MQRRFKGSTSHACRPALHLSLSKRVLSCNSSINQCLASAGTEAAFPGQVNILRSEICMAKILAAVLLSLLSSMAWSSVIFEWEVLSTPSVNPANPYWPIPIEGRIEIKEGSDRISFHRTQHCGFSDSVPCLPDHSSDLISFQFGFDGVTPTSTPSVINRDNWTLIDLDVGAWLLDGSITLHTRDTDLEMHSNNGLWTITYLNADWLACGAGTHCGGQTGQWHRVPEPGMPLLLVVGAAALAASRRRSRRANQAA